MEPPRRPYGPFPSPSCRRIGFRAPFRRLGAPQALPGSPLRVGGSRGLGGPWRAAFASLRPLFGSGSAPSGASLPLRSCRRFVDAAVGPLTPYRAAPGSGVPPDPVSLVHNKTSWWPTAPEKSLCTRVFAPFWGLRGWPSLARLGPPTIPPAGPLPFAPLRGLRSGAQPVDLWTAWTRRAGCDRARVSPSS